MGYFASGLHMTAGFQKMLPIGNSFIETYAQYADGFGGGNRIIVVLENKKGDIFQPDFLKTLNDATQDVFYIPGVARHRVPRSEESRVGKECVSTCRYRGSTYT